MSDDMWSEVGEDGVVNFYVTPKTPTKPVERRVVLQGGPADGAVYRVTSSGANFLDLTDDEATYVYGESGLTDENGQEVFTYFPATDP